MKKFFSIKTLTIIVTFSSFFVTQAQEAGNCADGIDNDGDGLIDCRDGDCFADAGACPAYEFTSSCSPTGGKRGDIIDAQVNHRDEGVTTDATFTIPTDATQALVYISSADGQTSTGAQPGLTDEDFISGTAILDLVNLTSSGFYNYAKNTSTDGSGTMAFGWEGVAFGDEVTSGAIVGHDISPILNDLTFSVSGSMLTITEDISTIQTSILVEFTASSSSSLISAGFGSAFLDDGTAAANKNVSIAIPAETAVISITGKGVTANTTNIAGGIDEGFSNTKFSIDLDAGILNGFATVANGGDADHYSSYVISDHDITSTDDFFTEGSAVGDITGNETGSGGDGDVGMYQAAIYVSGGNLVIERGAGYAEDFEDVYTIEFFDRLEQPLSAEFIESEIKFQAIGTGANGSVNGSNILSGGTTSTFAIPAGAEFMFFNMAGNASNSNNEPNENAAAGYAVIDFSAEVANGYYFQQVGFNGTTRRDDNVAFENLDLDGSSAVKNGTGADATALEHYDMAFELSTDKTELTVRISSGAVQSNYQYVLSADFFGAKPDLTSEAANIIFSKGANCKELDVAVELCNPGSGDSPEGMPVSFYDKDPTVDASAILLATQTFDNSIDIGGCSSFTFTLDLGDYDNLNFDMSVIINDDGSFVSGGVGTAVGTTFDLADLENQDSDFNECDYTNNRIIQTTGVNNCPTVDLDGDNSSGATNEDFNTSYAAASGAKDITDTDLTTEDLDDVDIFSATITLTNILDGTDESLLLSGALPAGITETTYNSGTGELVLTGQASLADYATALRLVQYQNVDVTPSTTDRSITFVMNDGTEDGLPATSTVSILTSPEIDITGNNFSIVDGDATPSSDDDTDFETISTNTTKINQFTISNIGTGTINLGGSPVVAISGDAVFTISTQPAGTTLPSGNSLTFEVQFAPTSSGSYTATISVDSDDADEDPYTFSIAGVSNDVLVTDLGNAGDGDDASVTFTEGGAALDLMVSPTITDSDDTSYPSATITVSGVLNGDEEQLILDGVTIQLGADHVSTNSVSGYDFAFTQSTGELIITANGGGEISEADLETLLDGITYEHTNDIDPQDGNRVLSVVVSDGDANSAANTVTIDVNPVNDAPVITDISKTGLGAASTSFAASDFTDVYSDPESDVLDHITIETEPINGTLTLGGTPVNANDQISLASLGNLVYTPDSNVSGIDSFTWSASDGTDDSGIQSVNITITASEECNNGIDDDGDGLIDCYDSDCHGLGDCEDFFYGQNTPTCLNPPAVLPEFTLEEIFRSDNVNSGFDQRSGVMVGDMDGDGTAEIVTHDRTDDEILIFNGLNGEIKQTISQNGGGHQFAMVALGDVDSDGLGDILVTEGSNSNAVIRRYEYSASGNQTGTGNAIFTTAQLVGTRVNYSSPQLADFDEDGSPEVYVGANIFNAETGALVAQDNTINSGWLNSGTNQGDRLPIAYNIFDSGDTRPAGAGGGTFGSEADGLEFVAGNRVYTVDGGAFQLAAEITGSNYGDGFVSLGDLDNDNEVDIIVTSEGYIFAWNPRTETGIGNIYNIPGTSSGGKANVGDFDNDGIVDIGFAGSNRYIVLEYNSGANTLSVKWEKTGLDDGSQRTGSTLYDFEGDGIAEVVYSEEAYLYIYSGLDGAELTRIPSLAGTRVEYPLVADVNNDGQAEIIVTAQEGNGPGFSGTDDYFVVYKSANSSWVSSREIWNQHGYHVTNINDDMTIPQYQQDIFHPQFGGSLNGFLVQTTYLDQGGEPTYATSDLVVTASSVDQNCASSNNGLDISMTIQNQGDWKAPRTTPITVYDADPYAGAANVIDTVHLPVTLEVGASRVLNTTVQDDGQDFTLFVLVNHNPYEAGTTTEIATPLAAGTTNTWVNECDYTNNSFSEAIINCNEEPVITDIDVSVNEDNTYTFAATDFSGQYTDAEGEPIDRIQITSLPSASAGILYLSGVAIAANDEIDFADLANITFVPVADFDGDATFNWNAHDGTEYALAGAAVNIDIIPVNDAPLLTLDADNSGGDADNNGFDVSYTEGDGVVSILDAADAAVSDIDDTQMASLIMTVGGLQDGDNEEVIINGVTFSLGSNNTQTTTIGGITFQIAYVSGVFTITNNAGGDFDIADINSLLATIQYQHTDGDSPTDGDRTLTFVTNDGDDDSAAVVSTISVASTNDAPVAVDDPSNELVEDGNITVSTVGANDTDVDGTIDASTIILIDPSNPSNTGNRLSDLIIAGVGTYAVDISGNVTFTPESGFTGDASVNYTIDDNEGTTSNSAEIGITVITKPDITLGANPTVCEGATTASLSYSATAGGANQYSIDYADAAFTDVVNATLPASPISLAIPGGTSEGVYTATLTVSNSSNGYVSTSKSISITINDTPSIGATPSDPTTCSGSDGSIAISGVKNATAYSVSYTFNASVVNTSITSGGAGNSLTITGLVEGTYTNISVTASGCPSNTIVSVTLSDPTAATIALGTTSNPTSCNGTDGAIQLTGLTASTNYSLSYDKNASTVSTTISSDGSGNYSLSGLTSGTYENFVVTTSGCTSNTIAGPVTLSDPNSPTITYDSDQDPASCSSTDGFIVLSSLTSGRDYQYSYTKNSSVTTGTLTADGAGKITINNLPAGTYTSVFVDDVITGCQSNVIPSLVLNPPDIQLGTVTNATTCSGTDGSIAITSLAANTAYDLDYSIDGTPVATASITADASGVYNITSLGEGAYTNIRFTNNGCVTNSLSTTITEPTPATIAQGTVSNPSKCAGADGSIQITGLSVSASYSVNYSDDGTPVAVTIGSDGSGNLTITGLDDGTYTNISVTKDNCTSNAITSIVLSDPDNPTMTLGSNPEVCAGTASTSITYSATTGSPDQYSINFDAAANTAGFVDVSDVALPAGSIPITVGTSTAGTYSAVITIKNSSISCTTDYNISVTVNPNPTITLGTSPEVCQGEISANLPYSAVSGSPDEYEIDFDATAEAQGFVDVSNITLGASPIAITVPAGANAAAYNATLKVINTTTGCESTNTSFTITVNEKPTITLGTNPEVCEGETSASLSYMAVSGGDQYSISFDATALGQGFADVAATALPSSPIAVTVPGGAAVATYNGTINAINSTTGCVSDSKPFTIKVNSTPDITPGTAPAVCMGETSATLGYSALSGGADQYSIDFDATAEGEGFVDISNAALPSSPISLTIPAAASMDVYNANLIVTNSSTGCVSSTKAITITVNDNPIFTLGTNPEVCRGVTSGSLPYTVSAGSPDQYSIDFDASAESQGFVDVSNAALGASPLSVTIPAAAVANSYNATITLTNSSTGCISSSAAFTVTVNTIPTISLGSDPEYCEGETTGGISYSATTGSPDLYSIDFADASFTDITNQAITATPLAFAIPGATTDGTYAATLTVSNATTGCVSAVNNFNVIVKNTPAITSASTNPTTCNGVDGSITLSGLNDAVTYTVSYNRDGSPVSTSATPSSGDIVLSGLSEGAYANIKVTEDGCDSNEIALITLSDPATATVTLDSQNNPTTCGGSDGSIVISTGIASAVSYTVQYSFNSTPVSTTLSSDGAGDITIGSLAAGQYENFKITANGCESNELAGPINLFDPTAPTISFTDGNNSQPSTCAATDGVIAIFGVVDNTSYDYDYTYGGSAVNGTVTSETSGNELRITGLNAGTYTDVSVTISGCQSNTLESIVLNPPDISIGTTVDPTTCSGTDGSIQIVGFAANTAYNINYDLDGTAVAEFGITSDGSGEFIITNLGAGAYTNITAENSGCTTSPVLSATLSDPAIPTIAEGTHSNPTTCSGTDGLIQLTGLNASTAYAVSYTVGGSTISNTLSSNASGVIEITGLGAGNYTNVTATLTNCESNALSITLTDPASPGFSLGNTSQEVCEGTLTSTTTYTITSGSADTYSIDFDGTATIEGFVDVNDAALSGGNITINIPAGADTRSYSAFVTVKNTTTNCESATVPVSLYINYEPTITLNAIPDICVGATEALITYADTLAGTDDYNIVWDAAALADGFANVTGGRLFSANPISVTVPGTASATTYNGVFTVENSTSGCVSQDYAISLTINENPSLTLGTNPEVCFGETSTSISYSGATGSPDQYMIDYDATAEGQGFVDVAISGLPSSPISLVVPAAAIPGTYNADLVVTNSGTSCNSSALPFTVTVNAYPTTPTVTAQTTGDTTPEISGSADNGSNITVIVGGATYTTVATATGWTIDTGADTPVSGTFAPNTNGVNEVQVTSESNNCSISDASTDELTIDTTDPIVPTVASQVTNDVNPTIVGTAEPGSQITVAVGGATFIVTTDAGGNWTVDTNNAPNAGAFAPNVNGANEVQVTSEDAAGNTSVDATTLELVIDTTDPTDPTIAAQTTNDPTPVITGTAEAGSTVTVVVSGATYTVTADGSGNWSVDTEVVTPDSGAFAPDVNGSNEVAVTSTDEAGNSSTDTTTLELIIDTTDPVTPTVVPQITNDTTPEITGTAEANSTVTVVVGGASYTVTADGSGDWSVDTGVLTPVVGTFSPNVNGTNEVSVTSTDAAGNSSTDVTNLELTIDTTDPATPTVASQTTNDTTPVISGTAEAGSTVTVVVSGATYTVTADGSGNWSIDTEVVIPDSGAFAPDVNGSNEVAVTSTDAAGNSTSDTSTLELIIDTTDPAVPTVVSQTTNDTTPSLTGTAEVGSTVTIVVAGATYTTTTDASGNWVINTETDTPSMGVFNPNVNGTNEVSVTSTDAAGNSSVDATTLELTIDTTPPTISVNAISVDDKINAIEDNSDITITGTSSGADGQTATIVLNGVTYNPVIAAGGNWSITLTAAQAQALPEGDNTLTADVDDAAGNPATQATRTVDHDTTLPATPTVDALLSNSTTPTITGTTGTGAALAAGETMEVTVNGATYTVTPDASGNWSVDTGSDTPSSGTLGTFSDGNTYQVVATVTDDAGNTSTDTSTDELTIDTTPPTISVNAISVDDKINAIEDDSDITITGTSSGADGQTATIVLNGVTYNPVIAAGGNWSITLTAAQAQALPEGDNTLTADVDDAAGNPATQATRTVDHDTTLPATPTVDALLSNSTTPTITGTTGTGAALAAGETMEVTVNGATYTVTPDASGNWSVDTGSDTPSSGTLGTFSDGNTYQVVATVTDDAGNTSTDTSTDELTIDTTPPTISVNAISVDDKINAIEDNSDITITGTSSGADGQTATIVLNGVTYNPVIAAGGNWSITLTAAQAQALPEGDNTLTADVDDAAGNSATQATRTVDHDTTLPATPTVDALLSNSTTPTITGTTGTGAALAAGETMEVTVNGATYTVTPDASGNWSVDTGSDTPSSGTLGTFSDGNTYQVVATVTDDAGNTSTDTSTDELTIDTTPPTISVNAISVDDKINAIEDDSDITITGTSSGADGQTATIVLNGVTYNPVIAAGGNWSITLTAAQAQALPEGDNTLTADVDDAAGNSATQATRTVDHDTTLPATPTVDALLSNSTTPTITGTTGTGAALAAGETMEVTVNGATYTVTPDASGNWSVDTGSDTPSSGTLGTFSDGNTYQVVATVTDDAGNTSTDTSTDELTIDTTPPTISVNAISVDDKINAIEDDSDITITGTSSGADGQTATIVLNGVTYNPVIAAGGNWSITLTAAQAQALPEGDNTLTADVDDAAGNPATRATRDIEHDSVAPTLAINVVSTDDIISALEDDSPVTISGTTDAEDGQTVTVVLNGETYTATVSGGTWSLDIPAADAQGLPEGTSTITANVSDVAGNPATQATRDIEHDSVAPAVPTVVSQTTDDITPVISGTAEAGSTVTVVVGGATYIITADATGNWSIDTETATPDSGAFAPDVNGTNEVQVTSTDTAGNSTTDASTGELIIDQNDSPVASVENISTDEDIDVNGTLVDNVNDPESQNLTFTLLTGIDPATEGTFTLNSDGTYTFEPVANFNGNLTLTYEVCDDGNPVLCDQETINITVTAVNDIPVATGETLTIDEDGAGNGDLSDNVTDVEGDALMFSLVSGPDPSTEGTVTVNPDGTYSFIPVGDFNGTVTFTYEVCDNGTPAQCSQATVTINVNAVNDSPVAQNDIAAVDPGNSVTIPVLNNDSDLENNTLTVSQITVQPANGTVVINADGTVSYTPNDGFDDGTDTFTYEVCDNGSPSLCTTATVTVSVPEQELAPTAVDDSAVVTEDGAVSGNVLDNDSDGNGDVLTVNTTPVSVPTNGTLVLNSDGTYTYTPDANFNGTDSFTYEVCDDATPALCSQATVTITVNPSNDAPTATGETLTMDEDGTGNGDLSDNVTDLEGDDLTFSLVSGPDPATEGTVTVNSDGTYTFVPVGDFNGTVTFTYEVCDNGSPVQCGQATVTVVVNAVNDSPVANDDTSSTDPGVAVVIDVIANDTDLEGNTLTVSQITAQPANGTVTINADGTVTYTPNAGFNTGTDTFTYEVCDDGAPGLCTTATVSVSVPREELAPVALDDVASVNEDEAVSGNVLDNDSDGNNDMLTVNTTPVSGPGNGTLVLNADGTYTYTPAPGFSGTDSFIYEVCDNGSPVQCDQATVTITVNAVNDAPVATPETIVTDEETAASGSLADNATDEDSANLTFSLVDEPDATEGVFSLNSDGTYTFTPAENFSGTITITYEVCDDGNPALCIQETISITVNPINDTPTANDDQISQTGFAQIDGTVADLVDDADNDPLQFTVLTQPGRGILTFNSDGTYSYAPENGFFGIVTFEYQVCDDATPSACASATITIEILSDGLDTDGDGILDTDEDLDEDGDPTNDDCDNDGTPNYLDTDACDSDGDGLSDDLEDTNGDGNPYNDDCDNDGTPNFQDSDICDTDGDGILDTDEDLDEDGDPTNDDCDNDGTPNYLDTDACDSDGDGLSDDLEDTNGDGNPYNDDCDNDGTPNFQDSDSCDTDGDGILDTDEDLDEDGDPTNDDCDNDGTPNYLDTDPCDSDGDGLSDDLEDTNGDGNPYNDDCDNDGTPNFQDSDSCDTDGDGILDTDEDLDEDGDPTNDDCDNDGTPNYLDTDPCDSDGDSLSDDLEDTNGDGNPYNDDCDNDGTPNFQDSDICDTDGDGILDTDEDLDEDGDPTNDDCDNDGTPNYLDTDACDSDGDGLSDDLEDTNGDGNPYNDDCDNDGTPNFQDSDSCDTDGDGILDTDEDMDEDGDPTNDDCDNDGTPNYLDTDACDSDGDSLSDDLEDTNGDGNPYNDDCDNDGTPNFQDSDSCDTDGDGILDTDEDLDEDGDPTNDDCDNDGTPNYLDTDPCDSDGDSLSDDLEDTNGDGNPYNDDCDNDGTPNFQDSDICDTDGDGILDTDEDLDEDGDPTNDDCDNDGTPNYLDTDACDSDGDGLSDDLEDTNGDGNPYNDDCDNDGTPNFQDSDSCDTDGDGILDTDEDMDEDGDPTNDDCDNDGTPNYLDTDACDSDGDSLSDDLEDTNGDGNPYNDDCDNDGTPNFQDSDSCDTDGDGILDTDEDLDEDGDPTNDDCDNDGTPNYLDTDPCDSDGDGFDDKQEDTNKDGNPYNDDCDDDGIPNFQDEDVCLKVQPRKGFTPDGDGTNDFFYIRDIENYPNNTVQIFNRWGNKIFEVKGYDNQGNVWRSESSFGLIPGANEVPSGTYYYLIDLGDGSKAIAGFVVVNR